MQDLITTPASVHHVARYILERSGDMSTMKLQKLCFFAQGWTLGWTSIPLFEEDFQAWKNGPVCYPLFRNHRRRFSVSADQIPSEGAPLQDWHTIAIGAAIQPYLRMTGVSLSELTHAAGTPWSQTRGDLPADASSDEIISKELIRAYFAERSPVQA